MSSSPLKPTRRQALKRSLPFDSIFKSATQSAPAKFWLGDGIHPSVPGHALMADAWREAVGI